VSRYWAVMPAAGSGSRMGAGCPKQYLEVAGATLLEHSLRALLGCARIEGICVAVHAADQRAATLAPCRDERVTLVHGAAQRAGSVLAGLHGLPSRADDRDWVLVHDAARPCLRGQAIERLIAAVTACGGLLAVPLADTGKRADESGRVAATLDRRRLWRAQTPQMFRLGELRAALTAALAQGAQVTDEAAAMERAGHPVQLVTGDSGNLKVTEPADLALAAFYLQRGGGPE